MTTLLSALRTHRYVRLAASPAGRSVLKEVSSAWAARGVTLLLQLVSVPLLTRTLGVDRFGAYALAASLVTWLALSDLGIGVAMQNRISECKARGEPIQPVLGTCATALATVCLVVSLLALALGPWAAQWLFRNNPGVTPGMATWLFIVACIAFSLSALGSVGTRVLYATGRGTVANGMQGLGSVLSFLAICAAAQFAPADALLVAVFAGYAGSLGLAGAITFALAMRGGDFRLAGQWRPVAQAIAPRAAQAFVFAIAGILAFNVEYLVMSQTLGPGEISRYNVLYRLGWVWMSLYWAVLTSAWPKWSEFGVSGQFDRIQSSARQCAWIGIAGVVAETAVLLLVKDSAFGWLFGSGALRPSVAEILLFGIYLAARCWVEAHSFACQSLSLQRGLLRITLLQSAVNIVLQFALAPRFGLAGVLGGMILSMCLIGALFVPRQLALRRR